MDDGQLMLNSGEIVWEIALTSMDGSRRAIYSILTQGGSKKISDIIV